MRSICGLHLTFGSSSFPSETADLCEAGSRVPLSGVHWHVSAAFLVSTGGESGTGCFERPAAALRCAATAAAAAVLT